MGFVFDEILSPCCTGLQNDKVDDMNMIKPGVLKPGDNLKFVIGERVRVTCNSMMCF